MVTVARASGHCGAVLRTRRKAVGFSSMNACAAASAELEALDPATFKRFSRSSLNSWELDPSGERLELAHGRAVRTLCYLLQWSGPDFTTYVGIPIGTVPRRSEGVAEPLLQRSGERHQYATGVRVSIHMGAAPEVMGWSLEPDIAQGATVIAEPGRYRPGDRVVARIPEQGLIVCRLVTNASQRPALFTADQSGEAPLLGRDAEILAKVVKVWQESG